MSADQIPIALLGIGAALSIGLLVRRRPAMGLLAWLLVIGFVPMWMGVTIKFYFMPDVLVGIVLLVAIIPEIVSTSRTVRLGLPDLLIAAFLITCLAPMMTGGSTRSTVFAVITSWLIPFLVGRLAPLVVPLEWINDAIAIVFTLVAAGLLIEAFTDYNLFVTLMARGNPQFSTWGTIQIRGDVSRAEGAFGHSIAAGSSVALAIPLTMVSRFPIWLRAGMVLVMGGGVVLTLSRVSMIGAALGVALMALLGRGLALRLRVALVIGGGALVAAVSPFVSGTLQAAGDEAANSANYRGSLTDLIPHISPLGFSPLGSRGVDGKLYFSGFQSIDSQLIYTGLLYGWFALIIGVIALLAATLTVLSRRASPATVAVVAQIPALATVALITQYGDFFWFVVGLAVYSQITAHTGGESPGHARLGRSFDSPVGVRDRQRVHVGSGSLRLNLGSHQNGRQAIGGKVR